MPGGELGQCERYMTLVNTSGDTDSILSTSSLCLHKLMSLFVYIYTGPTLKLKRFFVVSKYRQEIDAMYPE